MDILSVTTGVFALLATCVNVSTALKDFYDGAAIADTRIQALLTDVESFVQVLQLMKDTLEQEKVRSSFQTTGHIGNHWKNVALSIEDGQLTLNLLRMTLDRAGKNVRLLDGSRKHIRLKGAMEEIMMFQQQIKVYRDTLQLSLQTVVLWNQITFQESADKILLNLDELHHAIRRIASDINSRMTILETRENSASQHEEIYALTNLRKCVQSAASVVSSASTSLGIDHTEHFSVTQGSDFEGCFPSQPSPTMLRWISSNTVYEFDEGHDATFNEPQERRSLGKTVTVSTATEEAHSSDSESDLEHEIVQALVQRGKEKLAIEDLGGAERLLRNCLSRIPSSESPASLRMPSRTEVVSILIEIYQKQENWEGAQALLIQKMARQSRGSSQDDEQGLSDMLALVEVLRKKGAHAEALLHARRALKGYRKLGSSGAQGVEKALMLLVQVCHADGDEDEEEAYSTILSKHRRAIGTSTALKREVDRAGKFPFPVPMPRSRSPIRFAENTQASRYQQKATGALLAGVEEALRVRNDFGDTELHTSREISVAFQDAVSFNATVIRDLGETQRASKLHLLDTDPEVNLVSGVSGKDSLPSKRHLLDEATSRIISPQKIKGDLDLGTSGSDESRSGSPSWSRVPQSRRHGGSIDHYDSDVSDLHGHNSNIVTTPGNLEHRTLIHAQSSTESVAIIEGPEHRHGGVLEEVSNESGQDVYTDLDDFPSITLNRRRSILSEANRDGVIEAFAAYRFDSYYDPFKYMDRLSGVSMVGAQPETMQSDFDEGSMLLALVDEISRGSSEVVKSSIYLASRDDSVCRDSTLFPLESHGMPSAGSNRPGSGGGNTDIANTLGQTVNEYALQARERSRRIREISRFGSMPITMVPFTPERGQRKIVIIGDGAVGKSALFSRFRNAITPVDYNSAPGFNHGTWQITIHSGVSYRFAAADTPGQPEFDQLRCREIETADIILACFAIDDPDSAENIVERWRPDYRVFRTRQNRKLPWLLVGLKKDLREDAATIARLSQTDQRLTSFNEGERLAKAIGASRYLECSALTGEGVHNVFNEATLIMLGGWISHYDLSNKRMTASTSG